MDSSHPSAPDFQERTPDPYPLADEPAPPPPPASRPPSPPAPATSAPAPRRRSPAGWWVALGVLCYFIFGMQLSHHTGGDAPPDPENYSSVQLKILSRYMLGVKAIGERWAAMSSDGALSDGARQLDDAAAASPIDGLRAAAAVATLLGPEEGLLRLTEVDSQLALEAIGAIDDEDRTLAIEELQQDAALFRRAMEHAASMATLSDAAPDAEAPPAALDEEARERLLRRHGWFGELVIAQAAPPGDPLRDRLENESIRISFIILTGIILGALAFLAGFVLFVTAVAMFAAGRIRSRYSAALERIRPHGSAFVETAVLFLTLFIGVQVAIVGLFSEEQLKAHGEWAMIAAVWVMALIVFWPLLRGVRFRDLRLAYGWHANGRGLGGIFREIGAGIAGYLAGLPILLAGVIVVVVLMKLTASKTTHPIQEDVEISSWLDALKLYLLAAVWAPLVEETIFRGALFHQLRRSAGLIASAAASAFVFAIIHPQGYAGAPMLLALAINFALMREWRGSLIAPITAHALNNGAVITLLVLIMR